jgi:hypothetical protein
LSGSIGAGGRGVSDGAGTGFGAVRDAVSIFFSSPISRTPTTETIKRAAAAQGIQRREPTG